MKIKNAFILFGLLFSITLFIPLVSALTMECEIVGSNVYCEFPQPIIDGLQEIYDKSEQIWDKSEQIWDKSQIIWDKARDIYNRVNVQIDVGSTFYEIGETANIFAKVMEEGETVNDAFCDVLIFDPNQVEVEGFRLNYVNNSRGIYSNTTVVPNETGVYIADVQCFRPFEEVYQLHYFGGDGVPASDLFFKNSTGTTEAYITIPNIVSGGHHCWEDRFSVGFTDFDNGEFEEYRYLHHVDNISIWVSKDLGADKEYIIILKFFKETDKGEMTLGAVLNQTLISATPTEITFNSFVAGEPFDRYSLLEVQLCVEAIDEPNRDITFHFNNTAYDSQFVIHNIAIEAPVDFIIGGSAELNVKSPELNITIESLNITIDNTEVLEAVYSVNETIKREHNETRNLIVPINYTKISEGVWTWDDRSVQVGQNWVGGTEYSLDEDTGRIVVRIMDSGNNPVNGATCNLTTYNAQPSTSIWESVIMSNVTGQTQGVYYHDFDLPNATGVYVYAVDCEKAGQDYWLLGTFHIFDVDRNITVNTTVNFTYIPPNITFNPNITVDFTPNITVNLTTDLNYTWFDDKFNITWLSQTGIYDYLIAHNLTVINKLYGIQDEITSVNDTIKYESTVIQNLINSVGTSINNNINNWGNNLNNTITWWGEHLNSTVTSVNVLVDYWGWELENKIDSIILGNVTVTAIVDYDEIALTVMQYLYALERVRII